MSCFCFKLRVFAVLSFAATQSFSQIIRIYGSENAQNYQGNSRGEYYVQLAYFSNKSNADHFLNSIRSKINQPTMIEQINNHFSVIVGPIQSADNVRALGKKLSLKTSHTSQVQKTLSDHPGQIKITNHPVNHPELLQPVTATPSTNKSVQPIVLKRETLIYSRWYIGADVGVQWNDLNHVMTVSNGSDFPAPLNVDIFSTDDKNQTFFSLSGGHRWERDSQVIPIYALGLRYSHNFSSNVGQTITQYSMPEFTNYHYNWNVYSDVFLATAKLNLFQYHRVLPYVSGGIGAAINQTNDYQETALFGVTPRISPAFADQNSTQFAYTLGAGIDWELTHQMVMSLGYEYKDLGKISSGAGVSTWAGESLSLGSYQANSVVLSINYLFGK